MQSCVLDFVSQNTAISWLIFSLAHNPCNFRFVNFLSKTFLSKNACPSSKLSIIECISAWHAMSSLLNHYVSFLMGHAEDNHQCLFVCLFVRLVCPGTAFAAVTFSL